MRQTGKTERLINNIIDYYKENYLAQKHTTILICSHSLKRSEEIKKEVESRIIRREDWFECSYEEKYLSCYQLNDSFVKIKAVSPSKINEESRGRNPYGSYKRYFDEFDFTFLPNNYSLDFINETDYFVTSARFTRHLDKENYRLELNTDFLVRLLELNNFNYSSDTFVSSGIENASLLFRDGHFCTLDNDLRYLLFPKYAPPAKPLYTKQDLVLILGMNEEVSLELIQQASIVLRKTYKGYTIFKNRYGVTAIIIPEYLLGKFLKNPTGKLVTTTDWE